MAYQPIVMDTPDPLRGLSERMVEMARLRQQKDAEMAKRLREGRLDDRDDEVHRQNTFLKARELAAQGDLKGAQTLMAKYGATMQQREAPGIADWAPKLNQGELDYADEIGEQFDPPVSPLVKMAQDAKAKEKRTTSFLTGTHNGQQWTIDPDAARTEQQGRADEGFYQASGDGSEMADVVREQYPTMRAAAAGVGKPVGTDDALKHFQAEGRLRRSEAHDQARMAHQDRMAIQQRELAEMRDSRSESNNRNMTNAILGSAKVRGAAAGDASARGWNTQGEQLFKNYTASQGYTGQVASNRAYSSMLEDLKSGNTALMTGGLGAWVKEKSGGSAVVTENEIQRYLTSAMPWTEELAKQFNYWVKADPQLDQSYVKPFIDALEKVVLERQRKSIEHIGKGAKATFLADENPEVRAQANAAYTRAITPLMSSEQLDEFIGQREGETAAPAGAGAGPRPARQSGAPKPAAKPGAPKLSARDQKMVEWAQSHPNDPRAAEVLKANGM